jgi:hypothetical protein
MKVFNSKRREEFKLPDFLFWVVLAIIFPTLSGNFSFFNILHVIIYVGTIYFVGEKFLNYICVIQEIPSLIKIGLFVIFGSLVCGIFYILIPFLSTFFLFAVFAIFLFDLFRNKRILFSFSFYHFLCITPFLIILFQTYEFGYAVHDRYNHWDGDYYYYTAIVESLKTNQSLGSVVFHLGLPLNYPAMPFIAPAQLANFSDISSQFALWGVFMKIVPISCLSIISYAIVKIYMLLFNVKEADNKFPLKLLITSFLLLFFGPIHFLNIFKLDFKNALFLGVGYLLPTGSPGFALAMWIAGVIILLILSKATYSWYNRMILISLFCFALYSKIALFLPLAAFAGFLSFFRLYKNEKDLFITVIIMLPCTLLLYKICIVSADSIMSMKLTTQGFFYQSFMGAAEKYGFLGSVTKKLILMAAITMFMWLSIKLVILLIAVFKLYKKNFSVLCIIISVFLSFITGLLPGFFIKSFGENSKGKILFDNTYDMGQFVRGGIFIFTIISLIFVLYFLYIYPKMIVRKISSLIIISWIMIIAFSFSSNGFFQRAGNKNEHWYTEVKEDFVKTKPHLMAMMGNFNQSGQTVTTAGVHPWFCSGIREDGEGYVFSKMAYDRNYIFESIFNSRINLVRRKFIADSLHHLGVDCVVASPTTIKKIKVALNDSIISAIPGTKWFYRFN